jgi:cell division protein FtsZ
MQGLGACDPSLGAEAALEARIEIGKLCRKSVVLVAGLGGGTGTGAGPVVARIAKAHRCEVTAVVTMPFRFEGQRRNQTAEMGWEKFAVDRLVTVPLEDMLPVLERSISLNYGFGMWSIVVAKAVELLPLLDTTLGPENSEVVDVRAMLALVNRATEQSGASTY